MTSAYRFKTSITVIVQQGRRHRLVQLPAGSIFNATDSAPDPNGMIDGTCQGDEVMMFSRDLEDRTELMPPEKALQVGA